LIGETIDLGTVRRQYSVEVIQHSLHLLLRGWAGHGIQIDKQMSCVAADADKLSLYLCDKAVCIVCDSDHLARDLIQARGFLRWDCGSGRKPLRIIAAGGNR